MEKPIQDLQLTIDDLAFGGDGVAHHEGLTIFIPYTIPGEVVQAKILKKKKRFAHARLIEVEKASEHRIESACPYFQDCGGCQYQHISYEAELSSKEQQVRETLKRLGGIEGEIRSIIPSPEPSGYRNRITVHQQDGRIGFHRAKSSQVVDIERCDLASEEVNDRLLQLRKRPPPRDHFSLREKALPQQSFFQTNRFLNKPLQDLIVDAVTCDHVLEGFAGSGFLTEALVDQSKKIVTVEEDPIAVENAQKRLPENVTCLMGPVEQLFIEAYDALGHPEPACLIDPTREGLSDIALQTIADLNFSQLIYLSCNPSTLARDLSRLSEKWKLQSVQPIDMFPRTAQIECLAILEPA